METITLNKQISVSDPCYSSNKDFKCLLNVRPGEYKVETKKGEIWEGFGERTQTLSITHKDFIDEYLTWEEDIDELPVDSGMMSIYNTNETPFDWEKYIPLENAAVCSSGMGDGFYPVSVGKYRNQIVSVIVFFT